MTAKSWLTQLKVNGYRLTKARTAVVEAVANTRYALSPMDVYDIAKTRYPGLGLVSVYRTLEMLEELDMIQRVHQHEGCNTYLPQGDGHQHLIICNNCGKAEYFEGKEEIDAIFSKIAGKHGFTVNERLLQFFGFCSECEF